MAIPQWWRRYSPAVLRILAVTAGYFGAAQIGLELAVFRDQVTPLWPPTGVALAALFVLGPGIWPGITLGALLVNLPIGPSAPGVLLISLGNTLAPLASYLLLRATEFWPELERLRDALALGVAAFTGTLASATIGSLTLLREGSVPSEEFWPIWSVWWTGDAMGILVVAPLLLTLRTVRWRTVLTGRRWLEGAALLILTVVVTAAVTSTARPGLFLVFPLLIWAALRFQLLGATPCALIISVYAVAAAVWHIGPFADQETVSTMVTLQAFNGAVALTGLLLAAVTVERDKAHQTIHRAVGQLTSALARQPDRTLLDGWSWPSGERRPEPPSDT
ncbi:MAG: MASE1 domain-containing protein [Micromonosporaceae bacterium]